MLNVVLSLSICQFNSSYSELFSPIMPDEVREHLTRDQDSNGQSRSWVLCSVTNFCSFLGLDYCTAGRSKQGPL